MKDFLKRSISFIIALSMIMSSFVFAIEAEEISSNESETFAGDVKEDVKEEKTATEKEEVEEEKATEKEEVKEEEKTTEKEEVKEETATEKEEAKEETATEKEEVKEEEIATEKEEAKEEKTATEKEEVKEETTTKNEKAKEEEKTTEKEEVKEETATEKEEAKEEEKAIENEEAKEEETATENEEAKQEEKATENEEAKEEETTEKEETSGEREEVTSGEKEVKTSNLETKSGDINPNYESESGENVNDMNTESGDVELLPEEKHISYTGGGTYLMVPYVKADLEYNGKEQTPNFVGYDKEKIKISEDSVTKATIVGEYEVTFEILHPEQSYVWLLDDDSMSTDPVTVKWKIVKSKLEAHVNPQKKVFNYTGEDIDITEYIIGLNDNIEVSGEKVESDIGVYEIILSLKDDVNYTWDDNTTTPKVEKWEITNGVCWAYENSQRKVFTYDGTEKKWMDERVLSNENIIVGGTTSATNVGVYEVVLELLDTDNYSWNDGTTAPKTIEWEIEPQVCWAYLSNQYKVHVYNGEEQDWGGRVIGYDSDVVILGGDTTATDVGKYTVTLELINDNYVWADGTTEVKTLNWRIEPRTCWAYIRPQKSIYEYTGKEIDFDFEIVNYDEDIVKIEGDISAVNVGKYEVSLILKDPTNYKWSDGTTKRKTYNWSIVKPLKGDADGDNELTIQDVRLLLEIFITSSTNQLSEEDRIKMDMDGDGEITILDIRLLLQKYMDNQ